MAADAPSAWLLHFDPKIWDVARLVRDIDRGAREPTVNWPVDEAGEAISAGDRLFIWSGGEDKVAGVIALARALSGPEVLPDDGASYRRARALVPDEEHPRIALEIDLVLPRTLFRVKLQWDAELEAASFLPDGSAEVYALTRQQADALEQRALAVTARPRSTPRQGRS
jgi:hypothetical protein